MKTKIGNVLMNYEYYHGEDLYSDGDIENEILEMVKGDFNVHEILSKDDRWPVLYHLSPYRYNLLDWYPFKEGSSVLEIGAGCGGITGVICDKNERVVAVELSKKRAEINAYRNSDKKNLEIIVGNLNEVQFDEKFDYITLIGVLEYAGKFTKTAEPYLDFLKSIKELLKPGGVLIIAIENKLGLKYWAGRKEDHTGIQFEGLEGYISNKGVKTFGKTDLINLLGTAGFQNSQFYYPMPDYKLPTQIFSDSCLPKVGELDKVTPSYDTKQIVCFEEYLVFNNIIQNGYFDLFANSFLVFTENHEGAAK
ncbi:class I SAM-dependent methyltransferase [Paenibacillus sp. M-152]|uniref:class I SAM-dependent methyltransferase n=1 Tax=Paenibacillus sp. M-152 TaxID=2487928 RepID=UPI000F6BDE9C|nr:class I SAM-dependent methyltransferase [Paenibacillus sp. M-152]AZH31409.1 class I SAM-dependent methyltransferase [Paenibacillus sp. M-152]